MGVRKFAGEDEEFRGWVAKRPRGYVLNTHRDYSDRENTRLHRAGCFTFEPGFGGGAIQTGEQIKVCSPDPKELDQWAVANLGFGLRGLRCQHCDPTSLGLPIDRAGGGRVRSAASRGPGGSARSGAALDSCQASRLPRI